MCLLNGATIIGVFLQGLLMKKSIALCFLVSFILMYATKELIFRHIYDNLRNSQIEKISLNEKSVVNSVFEASEHRFTNLYNDIRFLMSSKHLNDYIENGSSYKALTNEWLYFSEYYGMYDQIRYIDAKGMEKIRVNLSPERTSYLVKSDELQNKIDRDYVVRGMELSEGDIYISFFDLNIEHKKVEIPHKPVLRAVAPLLSSSGVLKGVLVLNYLGKNYLNDVVRILKSSYGDGYFVDRNGYWLINSDQGKEWGMSLPHKSNLYKEDATLWSLFNGDSGRSFIHNDLYNYHSIEPFSGFKERLIEDLREKHDSNFSKIISIRDDLRKNNVETRWVVYTSVPKDRINDIVDKASRGTLMLDRVLSGFVLIFSVLISMIRSQFLINTRYGKLMSIVNNATRDTIVIADKNGRIISVNKSFYNLMGYYSKEVVGKYIHDFCARSGEKIKYDEYIKSGMRNYVWEGEIWKRDRQGIAVLSNVQLNMVNVKGCMYLVEIAHLVNSDVDVTNDVSKMYYQDPLTGLPNKLMFEERFKRSVDKFVVDDSKFSLIYFSLDGLSYVNDKYGYEVGDDVIISCANRLRNSFKKSDFVGRLGNGFIVIVEGANNAEEVGNIANVASLYMEQPIDAGSVTGIVVKTKCSIVHYPENGEDVISLMNKLGVKGTVIASVSEQSNGENI